MLENNNSENKNSYDYYEKKYAAFFAKCEAEDNREPYQRKNPVKKAKHKRVKNNKKTNSKEKRTFSVRFLCVVIAVILIVCGIVAVNAVMNKQTDEADASVTVAPSTAPATTAVFKPAPKSAAGIVNPQDKINAEYAVLVDVTAGKILAGKNHNSVIAPASMTKVMTLLVAAENIENINATFEMDYELLNPLYNSDATMIGFEEGEQVKIIDLFYGTAMRSGADSAMALAELAAGSEQAFVELMNKKAAFLGLTQTHFTNPIGLDDDGLKTTPYEMALIFEAALNNSLCKKVMSTEDYTITGLSSHPEGIKLKNSMFEKMYGYEPGFALIKGGKTGFTALAGYCLVSYAETVDNHTLICVTAKNNGSYYPIYDCFILYRDFSGVVSDITAGFTNPYEQ